MNYNQHKADETGLSYYQVTSGAWGCNLWAETDGDAAHIVYTTFPEKNGQFLIIKTITKPTKTKKKKNGGNNNG